MDVDSCKHVSFRVVSIDCNFVRLHMSRVSSKLNADVFAGRNFYSAADLKWAHFKSAAE